KGFELGKGTKEAYKVIRETLDFIEYDTDIQMYKELDKATELITSGKLLKAVEEAVELEH
ncbi:histidine ammonia-lyase, partial [Coprococcus sp. MSK.21.13]|nr:histidine ammonia-lyase [Coprococcus sp. MSK.21.13]